METKDDLIHRRAVLDYLDGQIRMCESLSADSAALAAETAALKAVRKAMGLLPAAGKRAYITQAEVDFDEGN